MKSAQKLFKARDEMGSGMRLVAKTGDDPVLILVWGKTKYR